MTKLDISSSTLVYSTYLGGTQNDEAYGIRVDSYGRAYVVGYTDSSDFPTSAAIQSTKGADGCASTPCADAFLSVLQPDGQAFAYSTFLGGDQDDVANGIALDGANNVYLVGATYSTNFPTTSGAYDVINTETDKRDAFIARVGALGAPAAQSFSHLDATIVAGSDDAEERASGTVNLTSISLELVTDTSVQTVGLRFTGANIPPGAVIQNAWVQFAVQAASSDATSLTLQAEASDNPTTFTSASNNISSRSRTTASVSWTPVSWNTVDEAGTDQRTPNLASVVQEIVDRPGWASGNALAIIITGSGKRVAKAYERDVYGAPYLHIEYTLLTPQLDLQIAPNPTSFTGSGQPIGYTYTLTNTNEYGPYTRMLIGGSRLGVIFGSPLHTYAVDTKSGTEVPWKIPQELGQEVEWSASGDWIVFSTLWTRGARADGDSEIYVMKYPEGNIIKVTDYPYDDSNPAWSPNGKKIAYESDGQIKVLDVECYEKLTDCKAEPAILAKGRLPDWSSNGEWISYQSEGQIYMISSQGGEPVNLTPDSSNCVQPHWSPVNMQIIFVCDALYILDVGSNTEPIKLRIGPRYIREPIWSPDGSKIAFISDREDYGLGKALGGDGMIRSNAVFLIDKDGSNLQRISPYDDEDILWYTWIP